MKDIEDLYSFITRLNTRVQDLDNFTLKSFGKNALAEIQSNFNDSGLHSDTGFKPWKTSKASVKRQESVMVGDTTLLDTYTLYNSIHYEVDGQRRSVKIGLKLANAPYAIYHDTGDTKDGIRRQFIYLSNKVKQKTIKEMDEFLTIKQ